MRAIGDGDAGSHDVAFDRSAFLDVDLLGRDQVARDVAEDDDRLGRDLPVDPAVGAHREDMVAQRDLAFHASLHGQILVAAQLAADEDALSDACQQLVLERSLLLQRIHVAGRRRRLGRRRRRKARDYRLTFPHRLTSVDGASHCAE